MGRKGNSRHINRLAASTYLRIDRKNSKYVAKQNAGRYTLANSIALITLLKEKMHVAEDSREARLLIKNGQVTINGKIVKDEKYPLGFGDVLSLKASGESFKIEVAKKGAIKVEKCEDPSKPRAIKVIGKYVSAGNKIMLRLYDGSTLSGKKEIMVNDSVTVKDNSIKSVIKFSKGAKCYVIKGAHASESGVIKEIGTGSSTRQSLVEVDSGKGKFQTLLDNIMVVGE